MFSRALAILVFTTAIGVALLALRHQRLSMMHEMAMIHARMNQSRQKMWDLQVRIADKVEPPKLAKAILRAKLKLEPAAPGAAEAIEASKDGITRTTAAVDPD
jgi:hypothetical protein